MKRVYIAFCPACPILICADEKKGAWGNDVGLPFLDHIGAMHPELIYTKNELAKKYFDTMRNN